MKSDTGSASRAASAVFRVAMSGFVLAACGGRSGQVAPPAPAAQNVLTTVYLIGDAGDPDPDGEPVFHALVADASTAVDSNTVIMFLGDNIYPRGMPDEESSDRADAERRLIAQVETVLQTDAWGIFLPGNHDWDFAGSGRRRAILNEAEFGEKIGEGRITFLPDEGCPGPDVIDVEPAVRLVLLDTQWWLFPDNAESVPDYCPALTQGEVADSVRSALAHAGGRHVIVAGHHPLESGGPHGGYFTFQQHLFPLRERYRWAWIPLPGLGSIYPMARRLGVTDQDLSGTRYRRMRDSLTAAFDDNPPTVFAAGHDHSLQLIGGVARTYQIVSGAGDYGHLSPVSRVAGTLYAARQSGFFRLQFQADGHVRLGIVVVDSDGNRQEAYSTYIE